MKIKSFLFAAALVLASSSVAFAREFLTIAQRHNVLRAVDNACGDAWCESGKDYRYLGITCSSEHHICVLGFRTREYKSHQWSLPKQCYVIHVSQYRDLVEGNGKFAELTPLAFAQLNLCLSLH